MLSGGNDNVEGALWSSPVSPSMPVGVPARGEGAASLALAMLYDDAREEGEGERAGEAPAGAGVAGAPFAFDEDLMGGDDAATGGGVAAAAAHLLGADDAARGQRAAGKSGCLRADFVPPHEMMRRAAASMVGAASLPVQHRLRTGLAQEGERGQPLGDLLEEEVSRRAFECAIGSMPETLGGTNFKGTEQRRLRDKTLRSIGWFV